MLAKELALAAGGVDGRGDKLMSDEKDQGLAKMSGLELQMMSYDAVFYSTFVLSVLCKLFLKGKFSV